jgi:hypothetical protein
MFTLKKLSPDAIPAALEKAQRYRMLDEPGEAESICLDVLAIDPLNQDALVALLLARTEQFERELARKFTEARALLPLLESEYARVYFEGLICERRAKAVLFHGALGSGRAAFDWFVQAMRHFERANELKPRGNDEAILRWNRCARILNERPDIAPDEDEHGPLLSE